MKREWAEEELAEHWTLLASERERLANKTGATRLDFAVLLKFFQLEGRFPRHSQEIHGAAVEYLTRQIGVPAGEWIQYDWDGRAAKYHRGQIRYQFGFREATVEDGEALAMWLDEHVLHQDRQMERLRDSLLERCRALRIEPPTLDRLDRLIRSAIHQHEERFCSALLARLSAETQTQLDALLLPAESFNDPVGLESGRALLQELRSDPGRASLESVREGIAKLERLRSLDLPADLFAALSPKVLWGYRERASAEEPHELRRHPASLRATLLAAYCHLRSHEVTDNLADLLIATVHRIGAKAEQRVERELIEDLKRVAGKNNLLFQMAEAKLTHPDGIVREVVFPVVDEQTLRDLVKEWKASGPVYRQQLRRVIRNSYRSHFRQMVPPLLATLEFRSNNERHRPVIRALELLKKYATSKIRTFPPEEDIPIDGVVRGLWHGNVEEALERLTNLLMDLELIGGHSGAAEKLAAGVAEFEVYIRNNQESIPNYGERYRQGETISTAFVESTINQVVSRRFVKRQQMHWTRRGAHLLLQTRIKVLNSELEDAFQRCYPLFRAQEKAA